MKNLGKLLRIISTLELATVTIFVAVSFDTVSPSLDELAEFLGYIQKHEQFVCFVTKNL